MLNDMLLDISKQFRRNVYPYIYLNMMWNLCNK